MSRADEGRRWRTLRWKPTKEAAPAGPWAQKYKGEGRYQQMVLAAAPPTSEGQLRGFVAQPLSPVLSPTPWTAAHQAPLSFTLSQSLLKLMSIELVMPSNLFILSPPSPPAIFLSIRIFSNKPALRIRWPKYWSFNFSISPSNEYLVMISFRIDWFDLLEVQGTIRSLLQQQNSKHQFSGAQPYIRSSSPCCCC